MSDYELKKYDTPTFLEVYPTSTDFVNGYKASPLYLSELDDSTLTVLYALLVAKYGGTPTINRTLDLFKIKLYSVIFKFGPTWYKKLDIQKKLRALTESEILLGATSIYNTAMNPEQAPTTGTLDELTYINNQIVNKYKKNKTQGYAELYTLLREDVTESFLAKFKVCFRSVVAPDWVFVESEEEEEDNDE